jgi:hypothetical protein
MGILLTFLFSGLTISAPEVQPDTNFKSIHQLQSEQNKNDTTEKRDNSPIEDTIPKKSESFLNQKQPVQTILNFSLMVVIILVLIIALSIFLIARRIYKTKE